MSSQSERRSSSSSPFATSVFPSFGLKFSIWVLCLVGVFSKSVSYSSHRRDLPLIECMVSDLNDGEVSVSGPHVGLPTSRVLDCAGLGDRDGVPNILGFLLTCPDVENSGRFGVVTWLDWFRLVVLSMGGCPFLELVTGVRTPNCRISNVLLGVAGSENVERRSFIRGSSSYQMKIRHRFALSLPRLHAISWMN